MPILLCLNSLPPGGTAFPLKVGPNSITQGGTEKADVKASIGKSRVVAFLQLKNIWKSKVLSLKKQDQDFLYKCQGCSSLRSRDMEDHSDHHKGDTVICQHMSKKNPRWLVSGVLKPSAVNGCGNVHVRCQWNKRSAL